MPLTPDADLELCWDGSLIPEATRKALGDAFHVRLASGGSV